MYLSNPGSSPSASTSTGKAFLKALFTLLFVLGTSTCFGQVSLDWGASLFVTNKGSVNVREHTAAINYGGSSLQTSDTFYTAYRYNGTGGGLYLCPRVLLAKAGKMKIAAALPSTIGFTTSQPERTAVAIDVNASIDIMGGKYAEKRDKTPGFGYYFGIGYGYTKTNVSDYEMDFAKAVNEHSENLQSINTEKHAITSVFDTKTTGLMVHAGIGLWGGII